LSLFGGLFHPADRLLTCYGGTIEFASAPGGPRAVLTQRKSFDHAAVCTQQKIIWETLIPRLIHEMQALKQAGTQSAPTSRRPSVVSVEPIRSHIPGFPGSTESSAPGTPVVQVSPEDFGMIPFTPPLPKSPAPQPPPPPDFDKAPYSKPIGPVFQGDEWAPLLDRPEDKVIKFLVACETLG